PKGYFNFTVYPLEGIWDLTANAKKTFDGTINKSDLVFKLMIRQPDFVERNFAMQILEQTKNKKPHDLLEQVSFEEINEGECIQMLHLGSYDNEADSFRAMERFAGQENYRRKSKTHREIYLSDARKVPPDKLRTVLRFGIEKMN
ncbi:MAG: GyrI-like domain-containing protein, partial [Chitinophagaceae bacterium]